MSYELADFLENPLCPALPLNHFPARWQAVVFRNWGMVPSERLARVLRCTVAEVTEAARQMGLPPADATEIEKWTRLGYLSIIRQNWDLLNYAGLLQLLDWSREKLIKVLREEDFLWHKLGNTKPLCPETVYRPLTSDEQKATAAIRALIAPLAQSVAVKPFHFLAEYEQEPAVLPPKPDATHLRMVYSYTASCGDWLADGAPNPFPPGLLAAYAACGVNAVWMPALLSDLTPWTGDADLSAGWETRQRNLKRLAAETARFGIGLYLYLNEPRNMLDSMLKRHPGWAGTPDQNGEGSRALCIRNPEVATALRNGIANLCRAVPDLAGFFTITMSENLTHCLSRSTKTDCPRCRDLADPSEEIVAVLETIRAGMKEAGSKTRLIAWSWAWRSPWDEAVLRRLPPDIDVMCVSETNVETDCHGVPGRVLDYSISHPGPGPMARRMWKLAQDSGHRVIAKVQLNASWELSCLPFIPVPQLVARHLESLKEAGVEDFMLCWTLGGAPGGNLPLTNAPLAQYVEQHYGTGIAAKVTEALECFSRGFSQFPFNLTYLIYTGPQNFGPANLLWPDRTGRAATMVGFCYDDVEGWSKTYGPALLEQVFAEMTREWGKGLDILAALPPVEPKYAPALQELRNMANAAHCILESSWRQIAFCNRRNEGDREACRQLAASEEQSARRMLALLANDSRIGFEASNHYLIYRNVLLEKVLNCAWLQKN
ncbi:MAG: hypothetical protein IJJ33_11850 [Victivallales bacterium]|nr:hypothetical protein [Victivallales bacterium]